MNQALKTMVPVLETKNITMRFGGVVAVNDLQHSGQSRRDRCADRPQRRRQDNGFSM